MIIYWTTWNTIWYLSYKLGFYKLSYPLKLSLFVTSICGGYNVYVHPRICNIYFRGKKYILDNSIIKIGDLLLHHIPLLLTITEEVENKEICGMTVLIPMGMWAQINMLKKIDFNKIYGRNFNEIIYTSLGLLGSYGLCYHYFQKK